MLYAEALRHRANADAAIVQLRGILIARDIGALGRFADRQLFPAVDPISASTAKLTSRALFEADQLVRTERVRAELQQRDTFQRSLLDAAQTAISPP